MLTGRLNKIAIFVLLIILILVLSNCQAHFYTYAMLKDRAASESEKALLSKACNEVTFVGEESDPSGGVMVFTWRCLSKESDSIDLSILVEGDGYPRRYTERLTCTAQIIKRGFNCETEYDNNQPSK